MSRTAGTGGCPSPGAQLTFPTGFCRLHSGEALLPSGVTSPGEERLLGGGVPSGPLIPAAGRWRLSCSAGAHSAPILWPCRLPTPSGQGNFQSAETRGGTGDVLRTQETVPSLLAVSLGSQVHQRRSRNPHGHLCPSFRILLFHLIQFVHDSGVGPLQPSPCCV